jgi:diamine N-acetyltransferase
MESPLAIAFVCVDEQPQRFFDFLPDDWRIDIAPVWDKYQNSSHIYVLIDQNGVVCGGGIVFTTLSPDIAHAPETAQKWLNDGYDYMAYLYIDEKMRGKGLGSQWLKSVIDLHPYQKYWLTIDDFALSVYYQKNGFELMEEIHSVVGTEWVLKYEP